MRSYRESDKYKKDQVKFCLCTCKGELRATFKSRPTANVLILFMSLLNRVRLKWNRNTQKLAKDISNVVYSPLFSLEPLRITEGWFQRKQSVWPSFSVFFLVNVSCLYKINLSFRNYLLLLILKGSLKSCFPL